jgi:hypothetical protein
MQVKAVNTASARATVQYPGILLGVAMVFSLSGGQCFVSTLFEYPSPIRPSAITNSIGRRTPLFGRRSLENLRVKANVARKFKLNASDLLCKLNDPMTPNETQH